MRTRGFTLVEMAVVVVIIAGLAGLATLGYVSLAHRTQTENARAEVRQAANSLWSYLQAGGATPATTAELRGVLDQREAPLEVVELGETVDNSQVVAVLLDETTSDMYVAKETSGGCVLARVVGGLGTTAGVYLAETENACSAAAALNIAEWEALR